MIINVCNQTNITKDLNSAYSIVTWRKGHCCERVIEVHEMSCKMFSIQKRCGLTGMKRSCESFVNVTFQWSLRNLKGHNTQKSGHTGQIEIHQV